MNNAISAQEYFDQGGEQLEQKDYVAAIDSFDEAIRLDPDFAKAYYRRGIAKYEIKEYFEAFSDCDHAIR